MNNASLKSYITLQLTYSSTCISLPTIHTHMYGHTPGTHQELAEQEGDTVKASSLAQQLEEIEERAEELDKQRTKGLSAIRSVAQINVHCHNFCCQCFNLILHILSSSVVYMWQAVYFVNLNS